jgi:hypothetical protein
VNLNALTLIGGLVLLISWVVQSTLYDYWNQRLSSLERAESIYIACLSSTFTMNAIQEIAPKGKGSGLWNNENFRLGLNYMLKGLSDAGQKRWSNTLNAQDADLNKVGSGLMEEVSSQQKLIHRWKARSRWLFIMSYVVGSIAVVVAESLKHG